MRKNTVASRLTHSVYVFCLSLCYTLDKKLKEVETEK